MPIGWTTRRLVALGVQRAPTAVR